MELNTLGDNTVLGEVPDTVNRPAPSLLLDAIKLFQRGDFEAGVKTVRDAIKETTQLDAWEKQWPRVSFLHKDRHFISSGLSTITGTRSR